MKTNKPVCSASVLLILSTMLLSVFSFSTKAQTATNKMPARDVFRAKVAAVLDSMIEVNPGDGALLLNRLKRSLNTDKMYTEILDTADYIVVVPVAPAYDFKANSGKATATVLMLLLKASMEVRKAQLVQYIPGDTVKNKELPVGTFSKFFGSRHNNDGVTGQLCFFSFSGLPIWAENLKDGEAVSYSTARARLVKNNSGADTCIDYYWLSRGPALKSIKKRKFLYETCSGELYGMTLNGIGGGEPYYNDIDNQPETVKGQCEWTVVENGEKGYALHSTEKFEYIIDYRETDGGHFTVFDHLSFKITGKDSAVFVPGKIKATFSSKTAIFSFEGKIIIPGTPYEYIIPYTEKVYAMKVMN